jgi:hypothetical protein
MVERCNTDAEFAGALEAGREEAETEMRALSVRYVADRDALDCCKA